MNLLTSCLNRLNGFAFIAGLMLPGAAWADEQPAVDTRPPIVLQPSDDPNPAAVQLSNRGTRPEGEPLRLSDFTLTDQLGAK